MTAPVVASYCATASSPSCAVSSLLGDRFVVELGDALLAWSRRATTQHGGDPVGRR